MWTTGPHSLPANFNFSAEDKSARDRSPSRPKAQHENQKTTTPSKPSLESAVLRILESPTFQRELPCKIDQFINKIENRKEDDETQKGPSREAISDILRFLASRKQDEDPKVELKGQGNDLEIISVRGTASGKESGRHSSKRQKAS